MKPEISKQNSTNVPLGAGETFTGRGELAIAPDVMVTCYTDAPGTLFIDFSINEGRTYPSSLSFDVEAGFNEFHTAVKGIRVCRARLVNGATPQTTLDLQVEFGVYRQVNAPISSPITFDADAQIVRTISSDLDLAFGRFLGHYEDAKFGEVELIDAVSDTPCTVWHGASDDLPTGARQAVKQVLTSPAAFYMSSSSALDTDVDLTIYYIDSDGYEQSFEYTYTAGVTGAAIGISGLDINRVEVENATPSGVLFFTSAAGFTPVTGVPTDPTKLLAVIRIGFNQTQQCWYRVPIDKRVRVKRLISYIARASGASGTADVHVAVKEVGKPFKVKRPFTITTASPVNKPVAGLVFNGGTIIKADVQSVSDNDTNVFFEFHFDLVDI